MQTDYAEFIRRTIRSVPDWPQPGVIFRDITPVLQDPRAFRVLIDLFVYRYMRQRLDLVAGVDARGFIVGSVLAYELNLGFVPVRKKGKLPFRTVAEEYSLEYGNSAVEMHTDSVRTGQRVLLVDDLIATGGTMLAAIKLLQRLGANVVEAAAIIDLPDLGGSARVAATGTPLFTVCQYDSGAVGQDAPGHGVPD
ncbi:MULTISPECIES: adenine phosphoribosyltransferase [unclassified Achromobacter]|uniref:adenine phosphoribosyltransferase n=1 Tax=unclassified Achromobacter TaxID=2626865 RepID=UPI00069E523E|nr:MULTISPECIES: adenine phosphoribosyltransferase [unclassified Achromobacter]KOF54085.1 adenine phosphoribosyltransferase [Achromobacter sp. DMS1]